MPLFQSIAKNRPLKIALEAALLLTLVLTPSLASAQVFYSQENASTLDSANCGVLAPDGSTFNTGSCGLFVGSKTHTEYASTTQAVTMNASSTIYATFYAGMDWASWGSFVTQPTINVSIGSCTFTGILDLTTLAGTSLTNPALFSDVPLTSTTGDCTDPPMDTSFIWQFGAGNWNGDMSSFTDNTGAHWLDYVILSTTSGGGGTQCGRTCIKHVAPNDIDAPIATSTPFDLEADGTIFGDDIPAFSNDPAKQLRIKWSYGLISRNFVSCPLSVIAVTSCPVPFAGGMTTYQQKVVTFGTTTQDFLESTSTPGLDNPGIYQLNVSVEKPNSFLGLSSIFGINFGYTQLAAKNGQFTVGTSTAYERYMAFLVANAANPLNATTTAQALNSCLPLPGSWNVQDCVTTLFIPSPNDWNNLIRSLHDGILTRAPWGYITRLASILEGNATSTAAATLPGISYTFPNLPGTELNGLTWNIDMQGMLMAGSSTMASFTDPTSGKSFREIVEPYVLLFIALSAIIIIFHDIVAIRSKMGAGGAQKK